MAFYQQDDEQLKQQQAQQQGGSVPASQGSSVLGASSATGSGAGGGSASAAPAQANTPDNPGNFVGVKTYLDANKNQASKLGDQASNVIGTAAQGARDAVGGLNRSFNEAAGSPTVFNPEVVQKVGQGAEKLSDDEKAQIKNQYNAQYKGPMDLTDQSLSSQYSGAQSKLNTAKQDVEGSGTEEGRKGLISQINSAPRTEGITNFDNILLQSGTGRQKLASASDANKDVTGDVIGEANTRAAQLASANKAAADQARTQTQAAVGGAESALEKQFDPNDPSSKLAMAISKALGANQSVVSDLGDNAYSLDPQTLANFGLTAGQNSFGLNPADYFTQSDSSKINSSNVASAEDYARAQALAELSGGRSYLNPEQSSLAGTADQYTGKFDKDRLASDIAAKEAEYGKSAGLSLGDYNKFIPQVDYGSSLHTDAPGANLNSMLSSEASLQKMPAPKGDFEKATAKDLDETWIPYFQKALKAQPNNTMWANLLNYAKSKTAPFKVSASNKFQANKV